MVKIEIPIVNWFDEPMKQSVKNVFDGINETVEAMDIFKKYRNKHFSMLKNRISKIFGMRTPISLKKYIPLLMYQIPYTAECIHKI